MPILLGNCQISIFREDRVSPGKAKIRRESKDLTIVRWSYCVGVDLETDEKLRREGIDAEVIDLRSLVS
ncbi:MAG: hypothetical protein HY578_09870 [Nitrospinae bacterium]|nr:hypothetical protein [Nitrospinota bacterium]